MRKGIILLLFTVVISACVVAQFTPGNIVVSRVGDGSTALSNSANQVQLVEYNTSGVPTGVIVTLPISTTNTAGNRACTNSGTATTEGYLTQSYDGRYLTSVGYDAIPGTASIATSTVNRTIARIDVNTNVDVSTSFLATTGNAYSGLNIRSGITYDGTQFWASGGSGATAGIRYLNFGDDNIAGTQLNATATNTRFLNITNDQLFIGAASGTLRVATVGTGLPTTSGQTITNLTGLPTGTISVNSFVFFDKSNSVVGPDLLYVACQSTTASSFGLFKYSYDGATWTSRGSIETNAQLMGLTGYLDCSGNPILFTSRALNGSILPVEIRKYTDNTAYDATMTNNGGDFLTASTLLVSAASNYAFRGIAMSPAQGYTVTGVQAVSAGNYNVIRVKSGGTAVLTGNIVMYDKIVIENGGILDMAGFTISSPSGIGSSFEVQSGGKIIIGSPDGITASAAQGNVQTCFRKYAASATYEYNSSAPQVTGNGLPAILTGTLTMNNTSSGVTLSQSTSVSGTLNLTAGKLITSSSSLLTLESGSTVINASSAGFVSGPLKKVGNSDFTFPIGKGTMYAPLGISGGAGAAATDAFTAEYVRTNPQSVHGSCPTYCDPGLNHISYVEYWKLSRDAGTASKQVSLQVHEYSFSKLLNKTYVSRWDNATSKWTNEATSVSAGPAGCGLSLQCGTITANSATTEFGDFTLATDEPFANNPLPIKLTRFEAVRMTSSRAMISWEVATICSKEARFELEKSTDGRNYILLVTLTGSETSRLYNYTDDHLAAGLNYYRLKATDADGKVTYSPVATVINTDGSIFTVSVLPNPAGEQAILSVTAAKKETVQFSIISSSGLLVRQWQQTVVMGTQVANIDLQALPAGIYQLVCQGQAERAAVRFIKH